MSNEPVKSFAAIQLRNNYQKLSKQINELIDKQEELLKQLQDTCQHEACAEVDYRPEGIITYANPPRRICLICGIEEDGWGAGYELLANSCVTVHCGSDRDKFYNFRKLDFKLKSAYTVE